MLIQFDKELNRYQTDVYLYYDEESQKATLDTFTNIGGNSWLDDDHYCIYSDKQHNDDMFDLCYFSGQDLADGIGVELDALEAEAREYHDLDDDEEVGYSDLRDYIKHKDEYIDALQKCYEDYIDDNRALYEEKAANAVDEFMKENEFTA